MRTEVDRCADWRALASQELDGELGGFDAVRLHRHLADCSACADRFVDVRRLTALLNEAELEQPARPIEVRALRRRLRGVTAVAAGGASAIAASLAVVLLGLPTPGGPAGSSPAERISGHASTCSWCSDRLYVLRALQEAPALRRPGLQNPLVD